jgi:DNA modification methylase
MKWDDVVEGDCIEVLGALPEQSVDLVFADPPFNIGYEYDVYDDARGAGDYLGWTEKWLAAAERVLKPTGSFFLAIGDEFVAEHKVRLDALGLTMRNWIVWHYTFGVNCLRRDTQFITSAGVRSFLECQPGEVLTVLSHAGKWRKAVVRNYGSAPLYRMTFRRKGGTDQHVWATGNHRWLTNTGECETDQLPERAILQTPPSVFEFEYDEATPDERLFWAYGYVFGDGSVCKDAKGQPKFSTVRLCGEDKRRYKHRFEELGFKVAEPQSIRGDAICYTGKYFKEAPDPATEEHRHIVAFVRGYLDADGAKVRHPAGRNLYHSIQASGAAHIDFIRKVFPVAGVYLFAERDYTGQRTNYGVRPQTSRFNLAHRVAANTPYRLVEVDRANPVVEDVWCLEVEEDHSFVLPNGIVTGNCSKKFNRSHAHILYFVKDAKSFTFNPEPVRVPSARMTTYADRRANPVGKLPDDTWVLRPQESDEHFQPESDTWYVPRVCGTFKERTGHPCQMPEAVLERIIRVASNPGDVVLDPFAGSGTTLAVAKKLGRQYLGVELSEQYADGVRKRLQMIEFGTGETDGAQKREKVAAGKRR